MSLLGSITKLQSSGVQSYNHLAGVFSANALISRTWNSMAQDMRDHIADLEALPRVFWAKLKAEEAALSDATQGCRNPFEAAGEQNRVLAHCFSNTLDFEEPLALKVYAPLIRHLRLDWSGEALGFYIAVKSHLSRILQIIQSFSGDPVTVRRATALVQAFEREVQVPIELPASSPKPASHPDKKTAKSAAHTHQDAKRPVNREQHPKLVSQQGPRVKVSRRARG
jgi:hypothetical protein